MITDFTGLSSAYEPIWWLLFFLISILYNISSHSIFWTLNLSLAFLSVLTVVVYFFGSLNQSNYQKNVLEQKTDLFDGGVIMFLYELPLATWWYIGVECIILLANDIKQPRINLPTSLLTCMLTLFISSLLILSISCSLSPGLDELSSSLSPLNDGLTAIFSIPHEYGFLLTLSGLFATAHGFLYASAIQVSAMAQSKLFPEFLARTMKRTCQLEREEKDGREIQQRSTSTMVEKLSSFFQFRTENTSKQTKETEKERERKNVEKETEELKSPRATTLQPFSGHLDEDSHRESDSNCASHMDRASQAQEDFERKTSGDINRDTTDTLRTIDSPFHSSRVTSPDPHHGPSLSLSSLPSPHSSSTSLSASSSRTVPINSLLFTSCFAYFLCFIASSLPYATQIIFPLSTCCAYLMYLSILLSYIIFKLKYSSCKRYFINYGGIPSALFALFVFFLSLVSLLVLRPATDLYNYTQHYYHREQDDHEDKYNNLRSLSSLGVPVLMVMLLCVLTVYYETIAKHRMHYSEDEQKELFTLLLLHRRQNQLHQLRRATFTGNKPSPQPVAPSLSPSSPPLSSTSPSFSLSMFSISSLTTYISTRVSFAITRERPYSLSATSPPPISVHSSLSSPSSLFTLSHRHSDSSLPRNKNYLFETETEIQNKREKLNQKWEKEQEEREKEKERKEEKDIQDHFQLDLSGTETGTRTEEDVEGDKKH